MQLEPRNGRYNVALVIDTQYKNRTLTQLYSTIKFLMEFLL